MLTLPPPTMAIVFPTIVAIAVFELVYVNVPSLFVVGVTIPKEASPNVFVIAVKLLRTVVALFTVKVAVIEPDK